MRRNRRETKNVLNEKVENGPGGERRKRLEKKAPCTCCVCSCALITRGHLALTHLHIL